MTALRLWSFPMILLAGSAYAGLDCSKASSPREKLVCAQPKLQRLDNELNHVFRDALKAKDAKGKEGLRADQRKWLTEVADKCTEEACLTDRLKARIAEIKKWIPKSPAPVSDDDDGENCSSETKTEKATLKDGVVSTVAFTDTTCKEAAHPDCSVSVTNTKNGKPLAIAQVFKKGSDPVEVLETLCEKDGEPKEGEEARDWRGRCDDIRLEHLALKPEGIVVAFDRMGPWPCDAYTIPWKRVKKHLAPDGPVTEAR